MTKRHTIDLPKKKPTLSGEMVDDALSLGGGVTPSDYRGAAKRLVDFIIAQHSYNHAVRDRAFVAAGALIDLAETIEKEFPSASKG